MARKNPTVRSLEVRLDAIRRGNYAPHDFIIADAKDADMGYGALAFGPADRMHAEGPPQSTPAFREEVRGIVRQAAVDILLASATTVEALASEGLFKTSNVTPAIRANDTTDVWAVRGGSYPSQPSRPFRTVSLSRVREFVDLGLYSITFNNDRDHDHASLEAYAHFREEAVTQRFRHFLEVFNPNAPRDLDPDVVPAFVNDCILRCLAGQVTAERPLFLKVAFNGRRWMEELAGYDASLTVGVLGGSSGTTRDTFELLSQAEASGAKVALFGRKIKRAECPEELVALFRPVLERALSPAEAVRAYHGQLERRDVRPLRELQDDQIITDRTLEGAVA